MRGLTGTNSVTAAIDFDLETQQKLIEHELKSLFIAHGTIVDTEYYDSQGFRVGSKTLQLKTETEVLYVPITDKF